MPSVRLRKLKPGGTKVRCSKCRHVFTVLPPDAAPAEVEELVEVGQLDPDHIHTPAVFVKRLFCGAPYDKKIEQRTIRKA